MLQKKSTTTPWKVIGNSFQLGGGGEEVLKANSLEAKYEAKLKFPGGREGAKQKIFHGGSTDIFWNCAMLISHETGATVPTSSIQSIYVMRDQYF